MICSTLPLAAYTICLKSCTSCFTQACDLLEAKEKQVLTSSCQPLQAGSKDHAEKSPMGLGHPTSPSPIPSSGLQMAPFHHRWGRSGSLDARRGQAARSQLRQLHRVCPLARKHSYPSSSCSAPRGLDISCKINIPHKHEDHCQGFPKETTLDRAGRTSCFFESLWRDPDPKVGFSNQPRSAEEL